MFKKSKKFVITGLVAGAMIAGGSFAAASYVFNVNKANTNPLTTVVTQLTESLSAMKDNVDALAGQLDAGRKKHAHDMDIAATAVSNANKQVQAANDAINQANTNLGENGAGKTVDEAATEASSAVSTNGTQKWDTITVTPQTVTLTDGSTTTGYTADGVTFYATADLSGTPLAVKE